MRSRSPASPPTGTRTTTTEDGRLGYLGLGSNLGDRLAHLRAAVEALPGEGIEVAAASSVYETEPHSEAADMSEQGDFLNACLRVRTSIQPEALLDICKAIEVEQGRLFGGPRHGPRPLDIDILLLGDLEYEGKRVKVPHPALSERRFVLEPLLELDPELRLPDGTPLAGCLEALPADEQEVRRVGPL